MFGRYFSTFKSWVKGQILPSFRRIMPKNLSASGGLCPRPPDQGLCPWTPLGAPPPDPRYRLALPRSPCPGLKPPPQDDTLASPLGRISHYARKYFFTNRVIWSWNSLPATPGDFSSLACFRRFSQRSDLSRFKVGSNYFF